MGDKLAALAVYVFVRFGVARRHKFKPTVDALGIFYWAFLELKKVPNPRAKNAEPSNRAYVSQWRVHRMANH